jgi:type VI secretion system protein ImpF
MGSSDANQRLVSSVIDRLLEDPTQQSSGALPPADGDDLRQLTLEVGRDLENLLNTRRRCKACPSEFQEVNKSLIEYGIPDFTGLNMSVPTEREQTRLAIERAIRQFEPRLTNVVVTVQSNVDKSDRRLRLRITGVLRTEPLPERVVFDSELEPSTAAIGISAVP